LKVEYDEMTRYVDVLIIVLACVEKCSL